MFRDFGQGILERLRGDSTESTDSSHNDSCIITLLNCNMSHLTLCHEPTFQISFQRSYKHLHTITFNNVQLPSLPPSCMCFGEHQLIFQDSIMHEPFIITNLNRIVNGIGI